MKSLIFLDDERVFADVTWLNYPQYKEVIIVRNMNDFILVVSDISDLEKYDFSFDHDIQDFDDEIEKTGYDCVKWLCDYALGKDIDLSLNHFHFHTQNPIGNKNMKSYINNFLKFTAKND